MNERAVTGGSPFSSGRGRAAPIGGSRVTGVFTPAVEIVTFCRQPKAKLPVAHLLVYSSIDKTAFSHSSYKEVNMLSALKQTEL